VQSEGKLLGLIGDTTELLEIGQFRVRLLESLRRAVPADWAGLSDVGSDPDSIVELVDPPIPPDLSRVFRELAYQNPLVQHYDATHDGRTLRISDLVSQDEFRSLALYRRLYGQLGVEYQLAFTLPHVRERMLGVHLSRRHHDFADDEVELIEAARPFLIQAYRNAIHYSAVVDSSSSSAGIPQVERLADLGLSHRQAEVLQLVATGAAERDIAAELKISHRTVQKHLQLCYRTLGVDSRSRAAAIAWSTLDVPSEAGRAQLLE
jgi:DNA-binding CsgD family transcriptional regulator